MNSIKLSLLIEISIVFLYTNNKPSEREIKEIMSFTIASNRIRFLGINLTKEAKDLYIENYKTLKKTQINGKIVNVHGIDESILLKCSYTQNNLQIQCNPYQNFNCIFTEIERNDLDTWGKEDGRVEGHAFTPSFKNTEITTNCWTIVDRKTLYLTKKDTPHAKAKEKPQWDGRRGAIIIKSNPITAGWVTHKLENTYTTEVHPLEWRFWATHQASQLGGLATGGGIPRESDFEG